MSDNVNVDPGVHSDAISVATDDINGVHYPIYKFSYGALGSQTPVDSDNPLPVSQVALTNEMLDLISRQIERQDEMIEQLKLLNVYLAEGFGFELNEEDIEL